MPKQPPKAKVLISSRGSSKDSMVKRYRVIGIVGVLAIIFSWYWGSTIYKTNLAYGEADHILELTQSLRDEVELDALRQSKAEVQIILLRLEDLPVLPGVRYQQKQEVIEQLTGRFSKLSNLIEKRELQVRKENEAQTYLNSAQSIALLATGRVQNPPHELKVWETALSEWARAVELLTLIDPSTRVYATAQAKLEAYKANYAAIEKRIQVEKSAMEAYGKGRQLMDEAITLARKSPYGLADLQAVQAKVTQAVQAFQSIPSGTGSSASAQNRLAAHTQDLQQVQAKVRELASCNPSADLFKCQEYITVRLSTFSDSKVTYGDTPVRASQSGSCDCPYDTDSSGNRCGDRSAYSRPGGSSPVCYK